MGNFQYKQNHVDLQRKSGELSEILAFSVVIPFFQSIQGAVESNEFSIRTRELLISQYGLSIQKFMGKFLVENNVVNIPIEDVEREFYYAIHMIFAHKNEFLKEFVEQQSRFFRTESFLYWRALYFVINKYYQLGDNARRLADELISAKSEWYSVRYVLEGDPQIISERIFGGALKSMFHNIVAGFQIDFVRTVLERRAGALLPNEITDKMHLPGLTRLPDETADANFTYYYNVFDTPNNEEFKNEPITSRTNGVKYRLSENLSRFEGIFHDQFKNVNVLLIEWLIVDIRNALKGIDLVDSDPFTALRKYRSEVRAKIANLTISIFPATRDTMLIPRKWQDIVYDPKQPNIYSIVFGSYSTTFDFDLPDSIEQRYEVYLKVDGNINRFNEDYLSLSRYTKSGSYFQLVTSGDITKAITGSKKSPHVKRVILIVWKFTTTIFRRTKTIFLNVYIISIEEPKSAIIVLNLSANPGFKEEAKSFLEESIMPGYGVIKTEVPDAVYLGYDQIFGDPPDKRVQVIFFGLWFAELITNGLTIKQIEEVIPFIGTEGIQNFIRTQYILPVTRELVTRELDTDSSANKK